MLIAEYWADHLGIELNTHKREPCRSRTRHLGFTVDLTEKVVAITTKHSRKIVASFNRMLMLIRKSGRILIKDLQKMLGLQIWISTVFKIARQFLTSICDLLRIEGANKYFYPKRHRKLVSRFVFDLKFWRRFVTCKPRAAFDTILGLLPVNDDTLASDASTSWGMAGVIVFGKGNPKYTTCGGLF